MGMGPRNRSNQSWWTGASSYPRSVASNFHIALEAERACISIASEFTFRRPWRASIVDGSAQQGFVKSGVPRDISLRPGLSTSIQFRSRYHADKRIPILSLASWQFRVLVFLPTTE